MPHFSQPPPSRTVDSSEALSRPKFPGLSLTSETMHSLYFWSTSSFPQMPFALLTSLLFFSAPSLDVVFSRKSSRSPQMGLWVLSTCFYSPCLAWVWHSDSCVTVLCHPDWLCPLNCKRWDPPNCRSPVCWSPVPWSPLLCDATLFQLLTSMWLIPYGSLPCIFCIVETQQRLFGEWNIY